MVQSPATTYFTCTLGQAALINADHGSVDDINTLVAEKAEKFPDYAVVGFANLSQQNEQAPTKFTFQEVKRGVDHVASRLTKSLNLNGVVGEGENKKTVALLCPSTPEFLFAWLGLIRLGYAVLLLAPQCQPAAIAHLCKECNIETLFFDSVYEELARNSCNVAESDKKYALDCQPLVFSTTSEEFLSALKKQSSSDEKAIPTPEIKSTSIAYLHHTSGTSTGLPKPIPQSHRAAVGVLPHHLDGSTHATFTTTPLYHGGVADLFRAWTSNAMIWLFPGKGVPITAKNILGCLDVAKAETDSGNVPAVKYFSSVPYVLQMMAAEKRGLQYLQGMDIVGVGGAALPAEVGDELVEKGVNLISRFGSAECGFLMSSHRDYDSDKEWQYLRADSGAEALSFEEQDGGLSELVVLEGWPHRAKTNRPNSSFATADLFAPHSSLPHAYRYHSRADSQLTLLTGKKFDPSPLESSIATSTLLDDVVIFGNGKPFPGALLFLSSTTTAENKSKDEVISALAPMIEKLNKQSQDHARIARNMLVVIPHGESKLEKSSKGTLMRNKAEETYHDAIEGAYKNLTASLGTSIPDRDVARVIRENIEAIIGSSGKGGEGQLSDETELFSYGVDSVASIQIRYTLRQLVPQDSPDLPLSVVEDCGTISKLADLVLKKRRGEDYEDAEDDLQLMHDLVDKYGDFSDLANSSPAAASDDIAASHDDKEVVVLTGATGALGAHLLHLYRHDPSISRIYCLVRGATPLASHDRVHKSLLARSLPGLDSASPAKVTVLPSKFSDPTLGLSEADYATLSSTATKIVHLAWAVNFRLRLRSFEKDHIAGLRHLLNLALSRGDSPPSFAFCSSVASVTSSPQNPIPESPSQDPTTASPLGYSRSKWVAEAICVRAHTQVPRLRGKIAVFRVGQLSGDQEKGVWNMKEAWPLMLGSARATGLLPDLGESQVLDWLAVDAAAAAMAEVIAAEATDDDDDDDDDGGDQVPVYHVVNPSSEPTWPTLLTWAASHAPFRVVRPAEWIRALEGLEKERPGHPALGLLGLWRGAYGEGEGEAEGIPEADGKGEGIPEGANGETNSGETETKTKTTAPEFSLRKTRKVSAVMRNVGPVDQAYFSRLFGWVWRNSEG